MSHASLCLATIWCLLAIIGFALIDRQRPASPGQPAASTQTISRAEPVCTAEPMPEPMPIPSLPRPYTD